MRLVECNKYCNVIIIQSIPMIQLFSNLLIFLLQEIVIPYEQLFFKDKILQNQLQTKAKNCSNKLTCVKNGMCIAHDYLSKLNPTNPITLFSITQKPNPSLFRRLLNTGHPLISIYRYHMSPSLSLSLFFRSAFNFQCPPIV